MARERLMRAADLLSRMLVEGSPRGTQDAEGGARGTDDRNPTARGRAGVPEMARDERVVGIPVNVGRGKRAKEAPEAHGPGLEGGFPDRAPPIAPGTSDSRYRSMSSS